MGWQTPLRFASVIACVLLASTTLLAERRIIFEAPGENGKPDVFAISSDGSELVNLTNHPAVDGQPHWSPDATQIAFSTNRDGRNEIYIMAADGSNARRITNTPATEADPDWSPDGRQLVVLTRMEKSRHLELINTESLQVRRLTTVSAKYSRPDWSADGTRVLFSRRGVGVFLIQSDGTGARLLVPNAAQPMWSPDGTRIGFVSMGSGSPQISVAGSDGRKIRQVTKTVLIANHPDW